MSIKIVGLIILAVISRSAHAQDAKLIDAAKRRRQSDCLQFGVEHFGRHCRGFQKPG
jgi:hypothetical protein